MSQRPDPWQRQEMRARTWIMKQLPAGSRLDAEEALMVFITTITAAGFLVDAMNRAGGVRNMDLLEREAIRYLSASMRGEPEPPALPNA